MEKEIILEKAIEIYSAITTNENKITTKIYRNFNKKAQVIKFKNDFEKAKLSLFLAALIVESDVKEIFNNGGLYIEDLIKPLGIKVEDIKEVLPQINQKQENDLFQSILRTYKPADNGFNTDEYTKSLKVFMYHIIKDYKYNSIEDLFILLNLIKPGIPLSSHQAISELNEFVESWKKENQEKILAEAREKSKNDFIESYKDITSPNGLDDSSKAKNSFLNKYGEVLTEKKYKYNPSIGREAEIKRVALALLSKEKSAMLIGEPGVGKTAIVEGFAYQISNGQVSGALKDFKIVKINTSSITSGCSLVGMIEQRMESLMREIMQDENIILFIDEIHMVIGAGAGSNSNSDVANILKPYLDRGSIKMIGSTTKAEYDKYIESDAAFSRRFETVDVKEPTDEQLKKIILNEFNSYEEEYGLPINYGGSNQEELMEVLIESTKASSRRGINKKMNPDLVLSVIRLAFAMVQYNDTNEATILNFWESAVENPNLNKATIERCFETIVKKEKRKVFELIK